MKKIIVIMVTTLFLGVAVTPEIGSKSVETQRIKSTANRPVDSQCEIVIREYHGDGTFTEVKKQITVETRNKLEETENVEEKLSLLKAHGLVSQEACMQKFENKVSQLANREGLSREYMSMKLSDVSSSPFLFNMFCEVDIEGEKYLGTQVLPIINILIGFLQFAWLFGIPSVQLISTVLFLSPDEGRGSMEIETRNGLFGWQDASIWRAGLCSMIGFAGFCIYWPLYPNYPHSFLASGLEYHGVAFAIAAMTRPITTD